ncbi:MAG TPA: hypothetical protein VHZ30_00885 [Verrucomicrobiae bacterium]|jgi:hypothetical protein|nr:hypothetical protein [Verrucomicrobiae bacterium]
MNPSNLRVNDFQQSLTREPAYPPGGSPRMPPVNQLSDDDAWQRLSDRQRLRIETDFIDRNFDGDFLGDILDAVTDDKRVALLKRVQGLWRTHRAVELGR